MFKEDLQSHQELAVAKAVIAEVEIQVELAPPKVLENQVILQIKQVLKKRSTGESNHRKGSKKGQHGHKRSKGRRGGKGKKGKRGKHRNKKKKGSLNETINQIWKAIKDKLKVFAQRLHAFLTSEFHKKSN